MLYLERRRASFTSRSMLRLSHAFSAILDPLYGLFLQSTLQRGGRGRGREKKRKEKSRKEEHKGGRAGGEFAQPQTRDTTAAVSSFHVDPVVDQNTVAGRVRSADRAGLGWRFRLQI